MLTSMTTSSWHRPTPQPLLGPPTSRSTPWRRGWEGWRQSAGGWGKPGLRGLDGSLMPARPVSARTGQHAAAPNRACPVAHPLRLPGPPWCPGGGPGGLSDGTVSCPGCSHNGQAYGNEETSLQVPAAPAAAW
ncbi:hypothetical protein MC885_002680 [Smutsia gigantea]|nr:hypothetical protein MC885_002680 [Smutsia gigantea]